MADLSVSIILVMMGRHFKPTSAVAPKNLLSLNTSVTGVLQYLNAADIRDICSTTVTIESSTSVIRLIDQSVSLFKGMENNKIYTNPDLLRRHGFTM